MDGFTLPSVRVTVCLQSTERGSTGGIPTGDGYTRNDPSCARYRYRRRRLEHSGRINRIVAVPLTQFIHSHDDDDARRRGRGRMEGGIYERVCAGDAVGNADATTTEKDDDEECARDASEGHRDDDCRVGRGCSDDESDDDDGRCRCASRRGGV